MRARTLPSGKVNLLPRDLVKGLCYCCGSEGRIRDKFQGILKVNLRLSLPSPGLNISQTDFTREVEQLALSPIGK